jgi:hypothetical protein
LTWNSIPFDHIDVLNTCKLKLIKLIVSKIDFQ